MDTQNTVKFLESQLFTLVVLNSVKNSPQLNQAAQEACDSALLVAASAIDKVIQDFPELESQATEIVKSFEVPSETKE